MCTRRRNRQTSICASFSLLRYVKKVPDVPVQMIKALARKRRIVGGFRQDEPALENGLRVTGEAFGRPVAAYASRLPRRFDVGLQRCGMAEDAAATRIANLRRTRIDLLRQRADEARELRDLADDDRLAERNIGKHALKRIGRPVTIGRAIIRSHE